VQRPWGKILLNIPGNRERRVSGITVGGISGQIMKVFWIMAKTVFMLSVMRSHWTFLIRG
jgi:hypothetical protein